MHPSADFGTWGREHEFSFGNTMKIHPSADFGTWDREHEFPFKKSMEMHPSADLGTWGQVDLEEGFRISTGWLQRH